MRYKSLDKKAITIMRINALFWLLIFALIFIVYNTIDIDMSKEVETGIKIGFGIVFFLCALNVLLFPKIRYERYKYLVNEEMIDVKKGLLVITRSLVPIERVQKIELTNGPIDRHYDLSTVVIYTAAGTVDIKFLNSKEAETITKELNRIIKEKLNEDG